MNFNYAQIAAAVYQGCTNFDPYLPPVSADLARAWGRLFEMHRLNEHDLFAGVEVVYEQNGSGYRPLPADIIAAARAIRRDRAERETERQARENAYDAALAAQNKARLHEICATIGAAHSVPDAHQDVIDARIREHVEAVATARSIIPNEGTA